MSKSYYHSFKLVLGGSLWRRYIRWVYKKGVDDLKRLNRKPDFVAEDFSCLLCGVGHQNTAEEFINFVTARNPNAKIWIIDLGEPQIQAVKKLVAKKYKTLNIKVHQLNALDLNKLIKAGSLNWIETDGFLEFFDSASLQKLIALWAKLLKPNGFITTRDFSTGGGATKLTDAFRIWLAKRWLGVSLFRHTEKEFSTLFKANDLKFTKGPTPLPTFKRFAIVKK